MDKLAADFKDKGVDFYNVYTREPHAGEDYSHRNGDKRLDFTDKKATKTRQDREANARGLIKSHGILRPIMIDIIGKDCVQNWLGGKAPNSLTIIDREGKVAFWQIWSNAEGLKEKLQEMTQE
jgi:hypothetical protein